MINLPAELGPLAGLFQTFTLLSCTALHCTVLCCTILCSTALYCTLLRCTSLHCTVLCCTALHCTALHCAALHCPVLLRSLCLSPKEDLLVALTSDLLLYSFPIPKKEGGGQKRSLFSIFLYPFHSGPIEGLDVCHRSGQQGTETPTFHCHRANIIFSGKFRNPYFCHILSI